MNSGCISFVLPPGLPMSPSQGFSNGLGNLDNLGSTKEIQP